MLDIVQQQYEKMGDTELQLFARNEAHSLTIQSFHLLKAEFEKRNLDISIINEVAIDNALDSFQRQRTHHQQLANELAANWEQYALEEKANGETNYTIYNALLDKGADPKTAFSIVQNMALQAKVLRNDAEDEIIFRTVMIVISVLLMIAAFSGVFSGFLSIVCIINIIICFIKIGTQTETKLKMEKVLKHIEEEKIPSGG